MADGWRMVFLMDNALRPTPSIPLQTQCCVLEILRMEELILAKEIAEVNTRAAMYMTPLISYLGI